MLRLSYLSDIHVEMFSAKLGVQSQEQARTRDVRKDMEKWES